MQSPTLSARDPVPYDAEGLQPEILAPCIIFCVVSPVIVALRFYSRKTAGAGLWWDDWLVLAALPMAVAYSATELWEISIGFGALPGPQRIPEVPTFFKALYVLEIVYNTALTLIKISILLLYRRIFPTRFMNIATYVLGGLVLLWFLGTEPTIIFQCTPIHKTWQQETPGTCFSLRAFLLGQAIPSIITDCLIFLLPLRPVIQLQMPTTRKLSVCGIFLLGVFAVTCSITRIPFLLGSLNGDTPDQDLYVFVEGNIWTMVELHVSLICACLPAMGPLIARAGRQVVGSSRGKSRYGSNSLGYHRQSSHINTNQASDDGGLLVEPPAKMGISKMGIGRDYSNTAGAHGSEDVELGDFDTFTSRQEADRVLGGEGIGIRHDVEVYEHSTVVHAK